MRAELVLEDLVDHFELRDLVKVIVHQMFQMLALHMNLEEARV